MQKVKYYPDVFVWFDSLRPNQHLLSGGVFLSLTSTKQQRKGLAQGNNTAPPPVGDAQTRSNFR